MAGAATIEVTSLMGSLEAILEVRSLEVQHAAALAEREMLHFQIQTSRSRRRWEVQEFRKLKVFASADDVLVILDDALLPLLAKDPTSVRALDLLERYANRLHTLSVTVGGTFEEEADFLHQDLIRHVKEGRAKPLAVSVSELVASFNSIRARITTLHDQVVGIGDNIVSDGDGDSSDDPDD